MSNNELIEIHNGITELRVTQNDLNDYFKSANKQSKIMLFKRYIVNTRMSSVLRIEFSHRFNNLTLVDKENNVYKFLAQDASDALKGFLDKYSVILE